MGDAAVKKSVSANCLGVRHKTPALPSVLLQNLDIRHRHPAIHSLTHIVKAESYKDTTNKIKDLGETKK